MSGWVSPAASLDRGGRATLVAIGNFDGVHRGHRAVLGNAVARAHADGLLPVVLTFHPHPTKVLGRPVPATLTPLPRKATLIHQVAPDVRVVVEPFDLAFAAQTPEQFAEHLLAGSLGARGVVVGANFRFGKNRAGSFETLRELGARLGFEVWAEPLVSDARGVWSSTRVRAALAAGDLDDANAVLGRAYELEGVVVHGDRRGRTIGFPTANLGGVAEAVPAFGVYAVVVDEVASEGGPGVRVGEGVANIGVRPTVAGGFSVEAHLFEFDRDLYGKRLRLRLIERIREERKFAGLDALTRQIADDVAEARRALSAARSWVDETGSSD